MAVRLTSKTVASPRGICRSAGNDKKGDSVVELQVRAKVAAVLPPPVTVFS
jgi:hypothetical protein